MTMGSKEPVISLIISHFRVTSTFSCSWNLQWVNYVAFFLLLGLSLLPLLGIFISLPDGECKIWPESCFYHSSCRNAHVFYTLGNLIINRSRGSFHSKPKLIPIWTIINNSLTTTSRGHGCPLFLEWRIVGNDLTSMRYDGWPSCLPCHLFHEGKQLFVSLNLLASQLAVQKKKFL